MPSPRDNPHFRKYGHLSGPAVYAPMFLIALGLFVCAALVMVPFAALRSVVTVASGAPGTPIPLSFAGDAPGSLVVVSNTPVAEDSATCEARDAAGQPVRRGVGWVRPRPLPLDGADWYPVAELNRPADGQTFTCSGPGLGELRAVEDNRFRNWTFAGLFILGGVAAGGLSALGFAMRRWPSREG